MNWISKLKEYAPHIAGAVLSGGATLPTLAMKAISDVVGQDISTLSGAEVAINGASPELMAEIKKADNTFKLEMKRLENDLILSKIGDSQEEHKQTQDTIRQGDNADDEYVRHTRPRMARQSWNATVAYCLGCWLFTAFNPNSDIFNVYLAGFLSSPAWAYIGFRTGDKFAKALESYKKK